MTQLLRWLSLAMIVAVGGCGGGGGSNYNGSSNPPVTYTISGVAGPGGAISPESLTVSHGERGAFLLTPEAGYRLGQVSGCGGTLTDNVYTTAAITGTCGVSASFAAQTFTVSGLMSAAASSASDADVNDPLAPFTSNDTCEAAQLLPNPVTLGGYLNAPGAGNPGRSFITGDIYDFYRVSLTEGQVATLRMAEDPAGNDLDVYLIDASCAELLDASEGVGSLESVSAPYSGEFVVLVAVYCEAESACGTTATNYALTIGQPGLPTLTDLSAHMDFVPGEVIFQFNHGMSALSSAEFDVRMQSLGLTQKAGSPQREMLMKLPRRGEISAMSLAGHLVKNTASMADRNKLHLDPNLANKIHSIAVVRALRTQDYVHSADVNYLRRTFAVPTDPGYTYQWHYPQINLPAAWDISQGDAVVIAVIDTGVLLDHPDLQGQLIDGYDFVSDPFNAGDGDGIDSNPDDPGNSIFPGSSSFHGTHVAGTVAARTNNNAGVAGVAWSAKVMPIRVLGIFGQGTSYDIIQGVRYAAGLPNDSGTLPPRRADIINLSLGGYGSSASEQSVYTEVRSRGVVTIAAAGNDNTSAPAYPASYDGVISVSAVDISSDRAAYSNFGSFIWLSAPGGDVSSDVNRDGYPDGVLSTSGNDGSGSIEFGYRFQQGTSMAAPHVSGVLALMKSLNPALTPSEVDSLLISGALTVDLGESGWDSHFGWGLIDAFKATQAASGLESPLAILQATPQSFNFQSNQHSALLDLRNLGTGPLTVTSVDSDVSWMTLIPTDVDINGLGTYTVSIELGGLPPSVYSATITVTSSANTVSVPVILDATLTDGEIQGNTGFQWVLLVDAQSFEVLQEVGSANVQGVYPYEFRDVPAGSYFVIAGSDADNDGMICDAGESCGAFPNLGRLSEIAVTSDVENVNFISSYNVEAIASGGGVLPRGVARNSTSSKVLEWRP